MITTSIQIKREEPRFGMTGGYQHFLRAGYELELGQALDAPRWVPTGGVRSDFLVSDYLPTCYYLSSTAMREGA